MEEGYDSNVTAFLDQYVFENDETPLLICLDEVDCVFSSPIKNSFFGSVRAFFSRGAIDPSWGKVRWLLATSSEPIFFIDDIHQSPFNIGSRVNLNNFSAAQVETFAGRHGLTLNQEALQDLMDYVGGRPYLVHLILYHLAQEKDVRTRLEDKRARAMLFNERADSSGIFREHLNIYLVHFQQQKVLAGAMRNIIAGRGCKDARIVERLEAAGLVRRNEQQEVVPLCRLYAEFFGRELS